MPVDSYGVGSSLIRGENDFTADVVMVDGGPAQRSGGITRPIDACRKLSDSAQTADETVMILAFSFYLRPARGAVLTWSPVLFMG